MASFPSFRLHTLFCVVTCLTGMGFGQAAETRLPTGVRYTPDVFFLGVGRDELVIDAAEATQVLLIGGAPFDEQVLMWWNYVARSRPEIIEAHEQWSAGADRFGRVRSPLPRIDTAGPPWPDAS